MNISTTTTITTIIYYNISGAVKR